MRATLAVSRPVAVSPPRPRPLRSVSATLAASVAIQGLTIVSGVVLARTLGPSGRGELTAVLLWPAMLAALGSLGIVEATSYFVARRDVPVGTVTGTSLAIGVTQSALLAAVGFAVVALVFGDATHTVRLAAYAYIAFVPINLLALYLMAVLNGLHRFVAFNAVRIVTIAGTTAGIGVLAVAGRLDVGSATVTYLVANFVAGSCAALFVVRAVGARTIRVDRGVARGLIGFGVKSHTSAVSSAFNERLDQLLISIFLAPARLGLYVVAVTLTSATSLVGTSVSMIALPAIARAPDDDARRVLARKFVLITVVGATCMSVPLLLATPWVIALFFGHAFEGAATVARILLAAGVLLSVNRTLSAVLKGAGRPLAAGTAEFMALGVTVAGLAVLLPLFGIVGAGIASFAAYAVSTAWLVRRAVRALDVRARDLVARGDA